ncbi:MAG: hypothetical protein AB7G47_20005 [Mycolicibacterium sp.]|uniref:hypothetical protein n=1 Tax=Mycolicibacterium sp. TaxID=2320850 RepID=UPI003D0F4699
MSAGIDPAALEHLSPKALAVVQKLQAHYAAGQWLSDAVDNVKEEVYAADDHVWACADGQGYLRALMIDDEAMASHTLEELEDVISDAMVEASGRGLARGEEFSREHERAFSPGS